MRPRYSPGRERLHGVVPPPLTLSPHHLLYLWLYNAAEGSSYSTTDENAWNIRLRDGVYKGTIKEGGNTIHTIEFPKRNASDKHIVYQVGFAEELGYVVVSCKSLSTSSNDVMFTCSAEETKVIQDGHSSVAYPTRVVFKQSGLDGVSPAKEYEVSIKPQSVRINQDIPDSFFTLPEQEAEHIYDHDKTIYLTRIATAHFERSGT